MMFDVFKKLDGNQDNGELNTQEPYDFVKEKVTVEEEVEEETLSEQLNTQKPYQTEEEKILSMLEELSFEEKALLAEKAQLVNMEENLRQRLIEEIDIRRNKIENLKHEIPELRQRCEVLARALDIPVQK
jgi:predicted RNase H-like nuclease (RuvC/YqgF family)